MGGQFADMLSYFGMSSDPFAHDLDQSRLLRLPGIEDSLSSLGFFCERRGIGVLAGKSGSGKSCRLRLLVAGLPVGLFKPVYLCHSTVSVTEFYGHLASAFNLPVRGRRAALYRAIQDHVLQVLEYRRRGRSLTHQHRLERFRSNQENSARLPNDARLSPLSDISVPFVNGDVELFAE